MKKQTTKSDSSQKKKKETPFEYKTNSFQYYANIFRQNLTEEQEIEKIDQTQTFFNEIDFMIQHGELINIQINGKVRMGKSTVGMALGSYIKKALIKYKKSKDKTPFNMSNVARDHQEFSEMMRNPETANTVVVTDENNELENTGENVSILKAEAAVYSDIQAARYVHRVSCSPASTIDNNADIILDIITVDRRNQITHCKLNYRYYQTGSTDIIFIGTVDINVQDIIHIWEKKVKKIFYKPHKNQRDQALIQKYARKDFYTYYTIKKHEKMELITKHGILRPRMLTHSAVILETVNRLKKLTQIGNIVDQNMTRNFVKTTLKKHRIPTSIIGDELATREALGVLGLYKSLYKIRADQETLRVKALKDPTNPLFEERKKELETLYNEIATNINLQLEEYRRNQRIQEQYKIESMSSMQ